MGAIEGQQVFELRHILAIDNVQLSARSQANTKEIIALVTQNGDLILYYTNGESPAVLRRVPWFLEREKRITSLSFHPAGTWLLITGWDGFLHIVPALSLVDQEAVCDQSWNPLDLTSFPAVTTSPPTCCVWWQSTALGHQMALVGTESGEIALINLNTGHRLGSRKISGSLSMLHICHDNADSAYLLMTCEDRQQWRVLLEDRDGSWFWPEEAGKSTSRLSLREEMNGLPPAPSTRSRLQGLKQLSVEKLAIIRQRLAETRSKTSAPSIASSSTVTSRRGSSSSDGSARSSDTSSLNNATVPQIENLRWIVNAFLWPQVLRGRQVLSAYHAQSSFLSMYKIEDLEQPPAYGHKLMFPCRDMLVTERFLYLTDTTSKRFSVVSNKLSESRRHDDMEHNQDSLVDTFEFTGEERMLALYKVSHSRTYHGSSIPVVSASGSSVASKSSQPEMVAVKSPNEAPKSHEQWLEQEVERLRGQPVDTCIIVTTHGVYQVVLKQCAVKKVLNHLLAGVEPDKAGQLLCAESLARMFGLDLQRLLELAGDIQLFKGSYIKAIELYKLARCRQIKWIVKLAAGGHTAQLLIALQEGALTSNSQDANPLERCQLSNLAILCQAQQYLSTQSPDLFKSFIKFLKVNQYYDEQMAVNILGQNHLWPFLDKLACYRGLVPEVLEAQAKMMSHALSECDMNQKQRLLLLITQFGFWESISEGCLREAFLQRPQLVRIHASFVTFCLDFLDLDGVKRLAALYDPTDPVLRPGLLQLLRSNRSREGSNERDLSISFDSASMSSYSSDFAETSSVPSENITVMEDIVMTFLLLLLQISRKSNDSGYRPDLATSVIRSPKRVSEACQGVEVLSLSTCELSAGFGHAALVRNSGLYTWGRNSYGCLGIGPSMNRLSQPRPVLTFNSLRTRVLSVACGQNHTLALTENGFYSWGSSSHGQLGLGNICQSPYPRLIAPLLEHRIVAIAAGQYHSLALTSTGRVFSWGWGVHGQLGLGSVENQVTPCLVSALDGQVVSSIGGGHAHSLFLLSSGQVLGCGSSVFGQLGTGSNTKSSLPIPVCNLPESIITIATGYFHNLAISKSNRLYAWGSSPQVLRMQAQAQKKARMLLQQQALQQQQQLQQKQQEQQSQRKSHSAEKSDLEQETKAESLEDQFQIITLKDCTEGSDETSENPASSSPESKDKSISETEKSENLSPTSPKATNNVRLNGPQEVFVDPLNAVYLFPNLDTNVCQIENPSTANSSDAEIQEKLRSRLQHEPIFPIPDLLAEAVPKAAVDLVQTSKIPTSNLSSVAAPSADLIEVPYVSLDADSSQIHMLPVLVDTSLVEGLIAEIACGCHHSALVTEEGRVYTWGRNIDGQLGHSGRKEASIPTLVPEIRAAQIACGADYTLALHADGQVYGWGSNSTAQVGRMPQKEPNKGLEGKTIMLNTSKRVIKIPNSVNNRIESPQEIHGIPPSSSTPAYSSAALSAAPAAAWAAELSTVEKPPYGFLTFHLALHRFYPYYNSTKLLLKSLEYGNLQAAGRLSLLAKDIPASLGYHLDALIASWKHTNSLNAKELTPSVLNLKNNSLEPDMKISTVESPDHASSSTTLTDENIGSLQTDSSGNNSEMHAFAVQGGNEEMSEGTDSDQTKSNQQPSDETSSLASVSLEEQDVALVKVGNSDLLSTEEPHVEKIKEPLDVSQSSKSGFQSDVWLQHEIFRLIELHMSLIEEEEQDESVISLLLQKVITFWVKENIQSSVLEELIYQHWDDLSHPFAVLLFCSDLGGDEKIAETMSTTFMMKLCSSLVASMKKKGDFGELNTLLTRLMAQDGLWNPSSDKSISIDQVVEHLTDSVAGGRALHIDPLHDSLDNNNIVAFSCGHQLNWHDYNAEVAAARTEGSALAVVLSDGEDSVFQHACPSCVAQYLQRIKL